MTKQDSSVSSHILSVWDAERISHELWFNMCTFLDIKEIKPNIRLLPRAKTSWRFFSTANESHRRTKNFIFHILIWTSTEVLIGNNIKISMLWKHLEDEICFQTSAIWTEHFAKTSGRRKNLQILKKVSFFQSELNCWKLLKKRRHSLSNLRYFSK